MLIDGLKFTDTAQMSNDRVEQVLVLPTTNLINGRQVELTQNQGLNIPGFYVYYNSTWNILLSRTLADQTYATIQQIGSISKTVRLNYVGDLAPTVGTARWYPDSQITLNSFYITVGKTSSSPISISLLKSGLVLISNIVLPANSYKSELTSVDASVLPTDYITADITSALSGKDLTLTLIYK